MREIEYSELRENVPLFNARGFAKGFFKEVASSLRKGVSLGLVLFLALGTLSILNRGANFVEVSFKERLKPGREIPRNLVIPRIYPAYVSLPSRPFGAAEPKGTMRDRLRESTYLLDAAERFSRTLGRFGR